MIVIPMQIAAIQTEALHVRAILDTQAMERFVKVWRQCQSIHAFVFTSL